MPTRPSLLAYLPPFFQKPVMLDFTGASPTASQQTVFIPGSHFLSQTVLSHQEWWLLPLLWHSPGPTKRVFEHIGGLQ